MDDDSDDDKPVMAAVMKLNAVKQEGEKNGKVVVKQEGEKNGKVVVKQEGEKNGKGKTAEKVANGKTSSDLDSAAKEKSKPSSSSSKSSRDSTTSAKRPRPGSNTEISDDDIPSAHGTRGTHNWWIQDPRSSLPFFFFVSIVKLLRNETITPQPSRIHAINRAAKHQR